MNTPIPQPVCKLCHLRLGTAEKTADVDGGVAHLLCAKLHEYKKKRKSLVISIAYEPELDDQQGR